MLNVKDPPFNAKGDGATDDTAAIKAAFNKVNSLGGPWEQYWAVPENAAGLRRGSSPFTAPAVYFPPGVYCITQPVGDWTDPTDGYAQTILGERAVLRPLGGRQPKTFFPNIDLLYLQPVYRPTVIRGMTFVGGRNQVSLMNSDQISPTMVVIRECEFLGWNAAAILATPSPDLVVASLVGTVLTVTTPIPSYWPTTGELLLSVNSQQAVLAYSGYNGSAFAITNAAAASGINPAGGVITIVSPPKSLSGAGDLEAEISECTFGPGRAPAIGPREQCVFDLQAGDKVTVHDCWISAPAQGDVFRLSRAGAILHAYNCGGGPQGLETNYVPSNPPDGNSNPTVYPPAWFRVEAGDVWANGMRLSGEPGARPMLVYLADQSLSPGVIRFENCATYSGGGDSANSYDLIQYGWIFGRLPTQCVLKNNTGMTEGLYFDPAIPPEDLQQLISAGDFVYDGYCDGNSFGAAGYVHGPALDLVPYSLNSDMALRTALFGTSNTRGNTPISASDLVRLIPAVTDGASFGQTQASDTVTNVTLAEPAPTNMFGTKMITFTSTGTPTFFNVQYPNALWYLQPDTYTVVFDMYFGGGPSNIEIWCSDSHKEFRFEPGRHVICWPINLALATDYASPNPVLGHPGNNPSNPSTVIDFTWQNAPIAGSTWTLQGIRVYRGRVEMDAPNQVVWDSSPPITGTWNIGDVVYNSKPTSNSVIGWVCTSPGASYTSDPLAAWSVGHAYSAGTQVLISGSVFQSLTAGVSARTGVGPTPRPPGVPIADGSITWFCLGEPVTFRGFGAIA